ncbi:hypothetical protein KIPB_004297 [Kipferlia bialata]|uniref:RING-type domain-containing protein n=1 Tax=Kipferlia bialata TaxID=797122 RepID=A0A9K3CVT7_9EUKA|nr:hypothetical protein KIPB_004297 [Kipferlia bialata]|eukprot:g4297.t1
MQCPICSTSDEGEWVATRCGHVFHKTCLRDWLAMVVSEDYARSNDTCPVCREDVRLADCISLFVEPTSQESPSSTHDQFDDLRKTARKNDDALLRLLTTKILKSVNLLQENVNILKLEQDLRACRERVRVQKGSLAKTDRLYDEAKRRKDEWTSLVDKLRHNNTP